MKKNALIEELYAEYANTVKHFLISLSGNFDLAEDLTQETFYQAYKSIHRYNGKCKISVWLCQIAKHIYYDYLKKAKHIQISESQNLELFEKVNIEGNIDSSLEKMLYLASGNVIKKWTQRYQNWDQVLNQLIVLYSERLTQYL